MARILGVVANLDRVTDAIADLAVAGELRAVGGAQVGCECSIG
jgi:hypothetical protein